MEYRKFEPLSEDHPATGELCGFCGIIMKTGDVPSLHPEAPADEEEAGKARQGRPYIAICSIVHWDCTEKGKQEKTKTVLQFPGNPDIELKEINKEQ